jgi:tetratricopeptide (TPR) repeat protein
MMMHLMARAVAALLSITAPAAAIQGPSAATETVSAEAALERLELARLFSDRAYAEAILAALDEASVGATTPGAPSLHAMRAVVLAALDRRAESGGATDALVLTAPPDPELYLLAWMAMSAILDADRMLTVLEASVRNVPAAQRDTLREAYTAPVVGSLIHHFRQKKLDAQRDRMAEALVALGWPGDWDPDSRDIFRKIVLTRRLEGGDAPGAATLAATISSPEVLLPLLVLRRYDGLNSRRGDPLQTLAQAIERHDRTTTASLAAAPSDIRRVIARQQFLRSLGRNEQAVTLLSPFTRDLTALAQDPEAIWLANDAAYALIALGRNDEAASLMARLVALDMAANPSLIGPSINYAEMLWTIGRPADAIAHIERLTPLAQEHANDYGRMWIASSAVCALTSLERHQEARSRLRSMEARPDDNPAALMRALLCMNEMDAAEKLIVKRLRSDEPEDMVLALQKYQTGGADVGAARPLYDRLRLLRERPAVQAALRPVGRVLSVPFVRSYYGSL